MVFGVVQRLGVRRGIWQLKIPIVIRPIRFNSMARPKKLETIVAETVGESILSAARGAYADAILEKLREQGVCTDGFPIDAFVDHALSSQKGTFSWDGDPDTDRVVTVSFTDQEERDLLSYIEELSDPARVADLIQESVQLAGRSLLRRLEKDWPAQKRHEDSVLYAFRKGIEATWGEPLDCFRILLTASRELFMGEAESFRKSKAKRNWHLREAMLGMHARALRTATAVLVLLENGLADDAYTRWRTLYELSVLAAFVSRHGDEAAKRYLLHEAVALKKRLENELAWGAKKIPKKQQREIKENYDAVVSEYGKHFKNDYGWAAGFVEGNYSPKFVDIEEYVRGQRIAPPYKESSLQIHGGRAGLLGLGSNDDVPVIGHSDLGLDIPLMHASFCLLQITTMHLSHCPSWDSVMVSCLIDLERKIDRLCRKAARRLEKTG